jgi:hypothetical protein
MRRTDIYRVHLRWNTWKVGLRWVNWLEMSMIITVIKSPNHVQEYEHNFILNGTSYSVIIMSQFGSYHVSKMLTLVVYSLV